MTAAGDEELFANFESNPPASSALIAQSQRGLNHALPADYVCFLQQMNGGEGALGDNAYLVLWRVEELVEKSVGYEVADRAPELLLFGSNGAGEAFAFDTRSSPPTIIAIPFMGLGDLDDDAIVISTSFRGFLDVLFTSGIPF
jgi:SMI1 / KNR4 family (SUKH-1)